MSWLPTELRTEGVAFWSVFVVSFLGVALWESLRPGRGLSEPVERRWGKHSLLFLVSFAVSAVLVPTSPVLMAASVAGSRFGLLNKPGLPLAVRWILAFLILDLTRYLAHPGAALVPFPVARAPGPPLGPGLRCLHIGPGSSDRGDPVPGSHFDDDCHSRPAALCGAGS